MKFLRGQRFLALRINPGQPSFKAAVEITLPRPYVRSRSAAEGKRKGYRMSIELSQGNHVSEAQAIAEISDDGFTAAAKDYPAGRTEPHRHDYDICLHILAGEFRLGLVEEGLVRSFGPGERLFVPAGTLHYEDHGPLRMVVGRRQPKDAVASI